MKMTPNTRAIPAKRGNVLIMDDDEAVRYIADRILSRLGFSVGLAEDGLQAVAMFRHAIDSGAAFAAVILDLSIPGRLGGNEVLGTLLELDPNVQAFVTSGNTNDPVMVNCRRFGFSGVIKKPFFYEDVVATFSDFPSQSGKKPPSE
jgi:CheY-like chemotaxis protein